MTQLEKGKMVFVEHRTLELLIRHYTSCVIAVYMYDALTDCTTAAEHARVYTLLCEIQID